MIIEEQRLGDRLEALDRELAGWAKLTRQKLLRRMLSLGVHDKIRLAKTISRIKIARGKNSSLSTVKEEFLTKSLRSRVKKRGGEVESIGFSFARHGIFLHRGVGKGRPVGSGAASNAAKPWLNVLEPSLEDLAELLADEYADIAAGELKISIPGVLSTTVKVR